MRQATQRYRLEEWDMMTDAEREAANLALRDEVGEPTLDELSPALQRSVREAAERARQRSDIAPAE